MREDETQEESCSLSILDTGRFKRYGVDIASYYLLSDKPLRRSAGVFHC